jgi:hypothetical protein
MVMVFACVTSASAMSWGKGENTTAACEKYNVSLFKFEKVSGVNGDIYRIVNTATAKVGDTVYFGGYAIGESSVNAVNRVFNAEDFKLIDLVNIRKVATIDSRVEGLRELLPIYSAQVSGATPTVNITLKSGDDVTELTYKGNKIVASNTEVVLGNFKFIRDAATGIVSVVKYWDGTALRDVNKKDFSAESYETIVKELAVLGVTMEDVEAGLVCMSNINLIKNFGNYCETVKGICWGEQCVITPNVSLGIPKTGDASVGMYIGAAFIALAIVGGVWYTVSKRRGSC